MMSESEKIKDLKAILTEINPVRMRNKCIKIMTENIHSNSTMDDANAVIWQIAVIEGLKPRYKQQLIELANKKPDGLIRKMVKWFPLFKAAASILVWVKSIW